MKRIFTVMWSGGCRTFVLSRQDEPSSSESPPIAVYDKVFCLDCSLLQCSKKRGMSTNSSEEDKMADEL